MASLSLINLYPAKASMLVFTNRELDLTSANEKALTDRYAPFSPVLNVASAAKSTPGAKNWKVTGLKADASDEDVTAAMTECLQGTKPVLVFLHGNNCPPASCFTRCQVLEDQYPVTVIGFSWTSEGYQPDGSDLAGIDLDDASSDKGEESLVVVTKDNLQEGWIQRKARRYAQAKVNAQHSTQSLARFLRLLAAARLKSTAQPYTLVSHSLGGHFLHYVIDHDTAAASLGLADNVVFMAACTGAAKHAAWIGRLNPTKRVYIAYDRVDTVLAAASVIDGDTKLGTDPGVERLGGPKFRYIDFENAKGMKLGAHRYFIADEGKTLSKKATRLFTNIFSSADDFTAKDGAKSVYPVGCSADASVCYMGGTPRPSDS